MANITEEHLHHMARRHHATMKKLDGMRETFSGVARTAFGVAEVGAGAWLGGAIEGRTSGGSIGPVPINLGVGAALLAASHLKLGHGQYSEHLSNLGNGFIGSYLAATGYAFGKRWKDSGHLLGGGGHPFAPESPAHVQGDLSEAQMAHIVSRMQEAAAAPHP